MSERVGRLPSAIPRPAGHAALDGIRVVDFSRVIAGPLCTQILADMGADIIKIENPIGGDETRSFRHPSAGGNSTPFLAYNRSKRSVALDIATPAGRSLARQLAAGADVVIENFTPGVMARHGLDYASLQADNPRLVYCSITAYGREGPLADRPGYDPVMQAESGLMAMNGYPDREPVRTNLPFVDMSTGMMAASMILGALLARDRLGIGQQVDVVLYDAAVMLTAYYGPNFLITDEDQARYGHAPRGVVPIGLFHASDGAFYMSVGNDRIFRRLAVNVLERQDIADDARFVTNANRVVNRAELFAVLDSLFGQTTRDIWMKKMRRAKVPAGPVRTISEAFTSPEIEARGLLSQLQHPSAGLVPNITPPYAMSKTPLRAASAPPLLGEHTNALLREMLGLSDSDLARYRSEGAFGPEAAGSASHFEPPAADRGI